MGDMNWSKPVWVEAQLVVETNKSRDNYRERLTDCCGDLSYKETSWTGSKRYCKKCDKEVGPGEGDGTQRIPVRTMTGRYYKIESIYTKEQLDD